MFKYEVQINGTTRDVYASSLRVAVNQALAGEMRAGRVPTAAGVTIHAIRADKLSYANVRYITARERRDEDVGSYVSESNGLARSIDPMRTLYVVSNRVELVATTMIKERMRFVLRDELDRGAYHVFAISSRGSLLGTLAYSAAAVAV